MSELLASTPDSTISRSFQRCIESFGAFLLALGREDCRAIRLGQVNLVSNLDEYGRLKIWGDQTKANLPAWARGSLDDTLRHDTELRDVTLGILDRLGALLSEAIPIAERRFDSSGGSDQDSVDSVSDDDSHSESNDDNIDDKRGHRTVPRIAFLAQRIIEQIRSLYNLSALLRRPKVFDKYISSTKKTGKKPVSEDFILQQAFRTFDYNHVLEKVRQWRCLTKSDAAVETAAEDVTPEDVTVEKGKGCEDVLWLCQRLSEANTRRRDQLAYWIRHPYDPKAEREATDPRLDVTGIPGGRHDPGNSLPCHVSPTGPFDVVQPAATPSMSIVSEQTFSTVALSDVYDAKTNIRPRTVYAPTAAGGNGGRSTSMPSPPKAAEDAPYFTCPYCGMTLDSNDMKNRQSWKRHVFRDLRPYVCTFEECQNSSKLFASRNDWVHHELQIHRRRFVCRECHIATPDRQSMREHLRKHYGNSLESSQLSFILDLCSCSVDETEELPCLLCGKRNSLSALQAHLAIHMEDIALFVLPITMEENESGLSIMSGQAQNLKPVGSSDTWEELSHVSVPTLLEEVTPIMSNDIKVWLDPKYHSVEEHTAQCTLSFNGRVIWGPRGCHDNMYRLRDALVAADPRFQLTISSKLKTIEDHTSVISVMVGDRVYLDKLSTHDSMAGLCQAINDCLAAERGRPRQEEPDSAPPSQDPPPFPAQHRPDPSQPGQPRSLPTRPSKRQDFEIAIICALEVECYAVEALLDEEFELDGFSYGKAPGDPNAYTTGRIGQQAVVLAHMPTMGNFNSAMVAANLRMSFEYIKVAFLVGVCGAAPRDANGLDTFLGDVMISTAVIQVDFGRQYPDGFYRKNDLGDTPGRTNPEIRSFMQMLKGRRRRRRLEEKIPNYVAELCAKDSEYACPPEEYDNLYHAEYRHKHQNSYSCPICINCSTAEDPVCHAAKESSCAELGCSSARLVPREKRRARPILHFGCFASGNGAIKSGIYRDGIVRREGVIAFEMEGAGFWDSLPTVIIKSACDYADSHKNKSWQKYASATAAACTKAVLEEWRSSKVD